MANKKEVIQVIAEYLRLHPEGATAFQIAAWTGFHEQTVYPALQGSRRFKKLKTRGIIHRDTGDTYATLWVLDE